MWNARSINQSSRHDKSGRSPSAFRANSGRAKRPTSTSILSRPKTASRSISSERRPNRDADYDHGGDSSQSLANRFAFNRSDDRLMARRAANG